VPCADHFKITGRAANTSGRSLDHQLQKADNLAVWTEAFAAVEKACCPVSSLKIKPGGPAASGWSSSMLKQQKLTMVCALLVWSVAPNAWSAETTFKTLLNFDGTNGGYVFAPLVQGANGNLYGVASSGGKNNSGTVFEITTEGKLTTLYNFCSKAKCTDGSFPEASLVLATNGNFYGTTKYGGVCSFSGKGCGTVFEITPDGKLTTLHTFCEKGGEYCSDGSNPDAPLIQATNGDLYGTTFYGGNSNGGGTLFEITVAGELTTLYAFCSKAGQNCPDGEGPNGLIEGTDGKLYGTTTGGGGVASSSSSASWNPLNKNYCNGTVLSAELEKHSGFLLLKYLFCNGSGADPDGTMIQWFTGSPISGTASAETALTFYGAASEGGSHLAGVIYSVTSTGGYSPIYSFCAKAKCADGAYPGGTLVEGTDGKIYGTTAGGNGKCADLQGCGVIYRLTTSGVMTTLHSFDGADGEYTNAGLVQATNGSFYGTTPGNGETGEGTVFSLSVGLDPFIKTVPTSAAVGTAITILGTDLTGTTAVSFSGKAAEFRVISATEIAATVPSEASTGVLEVKTPSATLKSNVPFYIP
jgi:uncharacterized repeat protein (TIGR03803 family)